MRVETYRIGPKPHMSAPGRAEARIGAAIDQAAWECTDACPDCEERRIGELHLEAALDAFMRAAARIGEPEAAGVGRSAGADGGD